MAIENMDGLENQLSKKAEEFVDKLQEAEELIINARTQEDRNTVVEFFNSLNGRFSDGKLLDEIEGHDDIWNRFKQLEDDVDVIGMKKHQEAANGSAEA